MACTRGAVLRGPVTTRGSRSSSGRVELAWMVCLEGWSGGGCEEEWRFEGWIDEAWGK